MDQTPSSLEIFDQACKIAKHHGLSYFKVGSIEANFDEHVYKKDLVIEPARPETPEETEARKKQEAKEAEDLLFYSAR
jgi:hypothetical protein